MRGSLERKIGVSRQLKNEKTAKLLLWAGILKRKISVSRQRQNKKTAKSATLGLIFKEIKKAKMRRKKTPDSVCYICGNPYVELHHIFEGTGRRRIADKYDFCQVWLCEDHHREVHAIPNWGLDLELKQMAQRIYEAKYGHTGFLREFTKSYLP